MRLLLVVLLVLGGCAEVLDIGPTESPVWEDDTFDALVPGLLVGQNGWVHGPDRGSPMVRDGAVLIDADGDETVNVGKDLRHQTSGRHVLSLRVRVDGDPMEDTLAKLEVLNEATGERNKLLQVFFGRSMRITYGSSGAATETLLEAVQSGVWYTIRCELDLTARSADVYVDDSLVAGDVVEGAAVTGLSLSAWDRAGSVTLDDLHGTAAP